MRIFEGHYPAYNVLECLFIFDRIFPKFLVHQTDDIFSHVVKFNNHPKNPLGRYSKPLEQAKWYSLSTSMELLETLLLFPIRTQFTHNHIQSLEYKPKVFLCCTAIPCHSRIYSNTKIYYLETAYNVRTWPSLDLDATLSRNTLRQRGIQVIILFVILTEKEDRISIKTECIIH